MNLYVILLFFVIQGPGPACGGHKDGVFSSEEPWTKEDLSGASGEDEEQLDPNSGANTDEDDNLNFDGYDSGSHSDDREHDDENPKTYPRASRSYSSTRTVTSGLGEDEGGGHEGGSHSKSQWNSDDESSNGDKDSKMDLTKIGDAIDVMKKLKKAKSDEEFAKKLNSGPESLGVAFKTFEQLSGLWISVMHRIWRVWKAKGAKEVMHSIVHSMLNNTRRAITRKVGNLLSNKTAILDLNDNGSGANLGTALPTLNEGSSQPEHIPHLAATQKNPVSGIATRVHNISETIPSKTLNSAKVKLQTTKPVQHFSPKDLPVKQIDVSFIKNLSKSAKTQSAESNHIQKSSSKHSSAAVILPVEDVKVSFSSKKAAISHTLRKSEIVNQSHHEEVRETDDTSGVTDFSVDKGKKKEITKTINLNDTTVGVVHSPSSTNVTSKSSSDKVSQPSHDINSGREPKNYKLEGAKAVPVDVGNQVERGISQGDAKQGNHDDIENKTDTERILVNETAETYTTKNNMEMKDGNTRGKGTSTVKQSVSLSKNSSQGSVGQGGQEPKQLKDSDKRLGFNVYPPDNVNNSPSNRSIPQEQHQNFQGTAEQTDTVGKTHEEETLKINFQKTDRKADLGKGNISKSQLNKASRDDVSALDSLKSGENKKGELEDKDVVDFHKGESDSANSYQQDQKNNQSSHASDNGKIKLNESQDNKTVVHSPLTSAPPQSENIAIDLHENLEQLRDKTKESSQKETTASDSLKGGTKDERPKAHLEDNSASSYKHDQKNNKPFNANTDKLQGNESQAPTLKDKKIEISQNETENSTAGENRIQRDSSNKTSGARISENRNDLSSKDSGNLATHEMQTNAGNASVAQSHKSETLSNALSVHHDHNDLQSVNNDNKHKLNYVSKVHDSPGRNIIGSTSQTRNTTMKHEGQSQGSEQNTQTNNLAHTKDPEKNDRRTPNALKQDSKHSVDHVKHHSTKQKKSSQGNSTKAIGNSDTLGSTNETTGRLKGNMDHLVKHKQLRIDKVKVESKKLERAFEEGSSNSHTIAQGAEKDVQNDSFGKPLDVKKGQEETENKASKQISKETLKEEIHSHNKSSSNRSEKDATSSVSTQNAMTISEPVSNDTPIALSTERVYSKSSDASNSTSEILQNGTKDGAEHMPSPPEHVIKSKSNDLSKAPVIGISKQSADSPKPLPVSSDSPSKSAGPSTQKTTVDTAKVERPPAEVTSASLPSSEVHRTDDHKTEKSTKQKSQHRDEKAKKEVERNHDRKSPRPETHTITIQQPTKLQSDTQVSSANSAGSKDAVRPLSVDKAQTHESESKENNKSSQSDSSRTEQTPTTSRREEIKPSHAKQVDVLTSRTPPTSLLTTSSDDNTYSIKQIVQGPNGTSYVYPNPDKPNVRVLERKVAKLESEVTVLETAMADLAKRLLVIEQRPENSKPTMPPSIQAENEDTSRESPVHHQQTTVYVGKDLVSPPKGPVPQPGPQRIVIPISSLYPEGEAHGTQLAAHGTKIVSPPSAPVLQMQDNNNDAAKADVEKLEKTQNMNHVAMPVGSQSPPASESHSIVRPIVNIIMPNNREDLLSEGALCIPRCQNGGRCLEGNTCKCATFFTGVHCQRFSLRDLLNSPKTWASPYRKLQRLVVTEPPDRQDQVERTFNLDSEPQTLRLKDLNQVYEPEKDIVAKQQPVEIMPPNTGKTEVDDGVRRKQLILEI